MNSNCRFKTLEQLLEEEGEDDDKDVTSKPYIITDHTGKQAKTGVYGDSVSSVNRNAIGFEVYKRSEC